MGVRTYLVEGVSGTGKTSVADHREPVTFCGGSRNFPKFIDVFDALLRHVAGPPPATR